MPSVITPQHCSSKAKALGFTLVELLVALALLAITSALAFRGISAVGEHRDRVEAQRLRGIQIEQTFAQLQADVDHLITMVSTDTNIPAPAVGSRSDGLLLLRRPRATGAIANPASLSDNTIDIIRYQANSVGLVRTVLGHAKDPIDLLRILNLTAPENNNGKAIQGESHVSLIPTVRTIDLQVWSLPISAAPASGGSWVSLAAFNAANISGTPIVQQNNVPLPPSNPAAAASQAAVPVAPAPSIPFTSRAMKVRFTLESGATLEHLYMLGPNQ